VIIFIYVLVKKTTRLYETYCRAALLHCELISAVGICTALVVHDPVQVHRKRTC
jgi:hypothetical protein